MSLKSEALRKFYTSLCDVCSGAVYTEEIKKGVKYWFEVSPHGVCPGWRAGYKRKYPHILRICPKLKRNARGLIWLSKILLGYEKIEKWPTRETIVGPLEVFPWEVEGYKK